MLVAQLRQIRQIKQELEVQLKTVGKRFPTYRYLLTIPGFGPIVATMTIAAIGDANRFTSRKQILRLAGLDLSAYRSGNKSETAVPVISKQGKAGLRYALVQAAVISSYKDAVIRNYFTRPPCQDRCRLSLRDFVLSSGAKESDGNYEHQVFERVQRKHYRQDVTAGERQCARPRAGDGDSQGHSLHLAEPIS
jgi:hypothetical protein